MLLLLLLVVVICLFMDAIMNVVIIFRSSGCAILVTDASRAGGVGVHAGNGRGQCVGAAAAAAAATAAVVLVVVL